ncbi:MAG: hypothetical protein K6G26_04635 [Lachnospiraceae bacterium]|nr:hypothetical protein [Lachnospiraceae bacterium]
MKKTVSCIIILCLIIFIFMTMIFFKTDFFNKNVNKNSVDNEDKKIIREVLELDSIEPEIIEYTNTINQGINNGVSYDDRKIIGKVESVFRVSERDFSMLKDKINKDYKPYKIYQDIAKYYSICDYRVDYEEVTKEYLNEYYTDDDVMRILGEDNYGKYFRDGFIKPDDEIDIDEFKYFIRKELKISEDEDTMLETFLEIYCLQYEIRQDYCKKLGIKEYDTSNNFELSNEKRINNNFMEVEATNKKCIIYYYKENDKYIVHMNYMECGDVENNNVTVLE